ncbi:MAG: hypothetical protein ACRERU_18445 [Methylococcales bacterium]
MLNRKSRLTAILIVLFSVWGSAFALEGEYKTPSDEDNKKLLDSGIEHAEAALAALKAGDAKSAAEHASQASKQLVEINSETWAGPLEGAKSKVRVSGVKAKKGDVAKATELLEQAIPTLKGLYTHSNKTHDSVF